MSEQRIKIPHRRLLPSSCTLPAWHRRKSNLPAVPVIGLAPQFSLQNPHGSNSFLFSLSWWGQRDGSDTGVRVRAAKGILVACCSNVYSYSKVPFRGSVPVWALLSCHGSDPSGEIRRSSKLARHNYSRNVTGILRENKFYPQVKDVCFNMALLNKFSNDKSNGSWVWWKKKKACFKLYFYHAYTLGETYLK